MKKIVFAILLVFALYNCSGNGKKQNDGNVQELAQDVSNNNLGFWVVKEGSQDSLRERDNKYIQIDGLGDYSNSQLVNAPLYIVISMDSARGDINMSMYVGAGFTNKDSLTFNIQDANANNYKIKTFGGEVLKDDEFKSDSLFREILKRGGTLNFTGNDLIMGTENSYQFIVKNADHFQDAMNAMKE